MDRVFACSDIHGMLDLYKQIKDFLEPDDKVYFLGDAGDRGADSWETIKAILSDPQFECLMGNHEDMFLKCIEPRLRYGRESMEDIELLEWNGGAFTYDDWLQESLEDQEYWYHKIKELPFSAEYINKDGKRILMSHAGFTPDPEKPDWFGFGYDLMWDRSHFLRPTPEEVPKDWIVIHGHTPIQYIVECTDTFMPKLPKALWYDNGRKCDLDQGAFYTYCTVLLDLDTFEEYAFTTEGYDENAIYD